MLIIKIGGGKEINLRGIIADLTELNERFIIVHGANALRDELAKKLSVEKKIITSQSGYSSVYSDERTIELLMLAYAGLRNKKIVELCQQHGINAVGLTGIDGKIIQGKRNAGIRTRQNGKTIILHDLSGKPTMVNTQLLELLLKNSYTPVITVPIIDESNIAINSENDDMVVILQQQLNADCVIHLIEAPGLLLESNNFQSMIGSLSYSKLLELEKDASGRIKRKLLSLRKLIEQGCSKIIISDGRTASPINDALNGKGTIIISSKT